MSSKMEAAMEFLQSYCNDNRVVKCKEEDFQALRTTVQKITTFLKINENRNRFLAHPTHVLTLVYALQTFPDRALRVLLVRLLSQLLGKSGFKKYAPSLVQKGLTRALFQILFMESNESSPNEDFLLRVHQILYRLGPVDRRFGIRARVNQCLPITLCLLRTQMALLASCSAAPSVTSGTGCSSNTLTLSSSSCTTGPTGAFSTGLTGLGRISPGPSVTTSASGISAPLGKCAIPAYLSAGSCNVTTMNSIYGAGSNWASGLSHGTAPTAVIAIPNTLNRHLTILLRTLRLYVSGTGKNNASVLGRTGAITLLLRLLTVVAGLPAPRSQTGRLSPGVPASKTTSTSSTTAGQTTSAACGGTANSIVSACMGTTLTTRGFSGVLATGLGNNMTIPGSVGNMGASGTTQDTHSSGSLGRIAAENGLIIGSPIVTAVTATASAAASLQRHRLRCSVTPSPTTKGFDRLVGSNPSTSSIGFLATTAVSMLSAPPALIAAGVRHHSNLLRLVLNTLHSLIRWKHNATRAVNAGGVGILLDLFLDMHRCDLHGRRIPLQRSALACLKCLTVARAGRKMFIACGGLHTLFAICAGYVGPDPLNRITETAVQKSTTRDDRAVGNRRSETQNFSVSGSQHRCSRQSDVIATSPGPPSKIVAQNSRLSSEKCDSSPMPLRNVVAHPTSAMVSDSSATTFSTVSLLSYKPSVHATTPSGAGRSNPKELSVAAGDSGFGAGDRTGTSAAAADGTRNAKSDELSAVLKEACLLLRRCCPRSRLPLVTFEGVLRFPLKRETVTSRWFGINGDGANKREALNTSDPERSRVSEAKPNTKDRSSAHPSDISMPCSVTSNPKKEERRLVRSSPRIKDQLASSDGEKRNTASGPHEHRLSDVLVAASECMGSSNQANDVLGAESADSGPVRYSHAVVGRRPLAARSKSRPTLNRPQRAVRHKSSANSVGTGTVPKLHPSQPFTVGAKCQRGASNPSTRRRTQSTWLKRGTKAGYKIEGHLETPRSSRIEERARILLSASPKSPSRCNRPHSLLSTSRSGLSLDSPNTPCQSMTCHTSPSRAVQMGFNLNRKLPQSALVTSVETSYGSHSGSLVNDQHPTSVCAHSLSSPTVLVDVDDDDDGEDEPDEDEDGGLRIRSRQADYDDDDDDDGDDDLDDDDDGREAGSGADEPGDGVSAAVSLAELMKSHGRFFPEWIDLQEEAPSAFTQDHLMNSTDIGTSAWPFPVSGDSEPGIIRQVDSSDDLSAHQFCTTASCRITDMKKIPDQPAQFPVGVHPYLGYARYTQSLMPFQLIAYPDLIGATGAPHLEPFGVYPNSRPVVPVILSAQGAETNVSVPVHANALDYTTPDVEQTTVFVSRNESHRRVRCKPNKCDRRPTGSNRLGASTSGIRRRATGHKNAVTESVITKPSRLPYSLIGLQHAEILDDVRRLIDPEDMLNRTVFDLDEAILSMTRELQHCHHVRSMDSRNNSPRVNMVRVAVTHPTTDIDFNPISSSTTPSQQQAQQQQPSWNRITTGSAMHTSPSLTVPNRTTTSPESHRGTSTVPRHPSATSLSHLTDGCECGCHGDCMLTNEDEARIDQFDLEKDFLNFESRFECGNLRKAVQVRQFEYDLILNPDINTISNLQWFYFRVSNVESGVEYRFNIINCEKPGSQFTSGMQPLLFSVREALEGRPYWIRTGTRVNYYRNHFVRPSNGKHSVDGSTYHTATFHIRFPHTGDVCYLAYHYPYTYTRLLTDIARWQTQANEPHSDPIYFRVQSLTTSLLENPVPVLTITAGRTESTDQRPVPSDESERQRSSPESVTTAKVQSRPYIFLTARVHSGESNSSWVIQGLLDRLLSDDPIAVRARQQFIFKIVPMLNPDGVICGNHRCSMAGKDLNRRWANPSSLHHPTIYHTKKLLHLLNACDRSPFVFIDLHGHSRMKNIFLYGCSPFESWKTPDTNNPTYRGPGLGEDPSYRHLAAVLSEFAPAFSKRSCLYVVSKAKETTARVAVWREFGVIRSYTIEASYCGVTQYAGQPSGALNSSDTSQPIQSENGHQINPAHLQAFGAQLLGAFGHLPTHTDLMTVSDLMTKIPDAPAQFVHEVEQNRTTEPSDLSFIQPVSSNGLRFRLGSPSVDSNGSLLSTASPASSVHSFCTRSSASLSAHLSRSISSLSSSSMTDG